MTYKTIHTTYGLAKIAAAEATGVPINLTHMAVGDGNGIPVTPSESQTALVREMYRNTVNRVYLDPADPLQFIAELIIPVSIGGFVVRECGIFDSDGGLFAVGNIPETYKPTSLEGAFSDMVVRLLFKVSNAEVITIIIDPNVAVASQSWVLNTITPCHLFPGGTTGQILKKASNTCGDTIWAPPDVVDVIVNVIEEKQILAAAQTTVTLTTTTTDSLAVYIEGARLGHEVGADGWQADVAFPDTKIVLGKSYPAGTVIRMVQNDPLGAAIYPLARDANLSDVPSKPVARTNLDVFSKAEVRQLVPPGIVDHYAGTTAPPGWLKRNGAAISRTSYAELFAVIGTTFGPGDGFNTFNLPDDRGLFDRGWTDGSSIDTGRAFGSSQADELKNHTHNTPVHLDRSPGGDGNAVYGDEPYYGSALITSSAIGGVETRPKNRAYLPIIKY